MVVDGVWDDLHFTGSGVLVYEVQSETESDIGDDRTKSSPRSESAKARRAFRETNDEHDAAAADPLYP
jgi:hypothetical protein